MKPAPAWQRRPKRRATVPPIPAAPAATDDRAARAEQWRADAARRLAITAGATDLTEQARRLYEAGEIGREMAISLGVQL